ncbi:hypothetical protein niasHT_032834 [Heterodera trifolii]|uniref:Uncharacterized protein n=1 Tax=Heterodera trifolii TaxID=157864 RepID=A0ABD2ITC0_9BILA
MLKIKYSNDEVPSISGLFDDKTEEEEEEEGELKEDNEEALASPQKSLITDNRIGEFGDEQHEEEQAEFTPMGCVLLKGGGDEIAMVRIGRLKRELENAQQSGDDQLLFRCCDALMDRMPDQLQLDSDECTVAFDLDKFDEGAVQTLEQLLLIGPLTPLNGNS